jgi:hypothetical protein
MSILTDAMCYCPPRCIDGVADSRTAIAIVNAHVDEVMSHPAYRLGASWAIQHLRTGDPHQAALAIVAHIPAFQSGRVSLAGVERSARGNALLERDRHRPRLSLLPPGAHRISREPPLRGVTAMPTRGMVDPWPLIALLDRDFGPLLVDAGVTPASRQILAPWLGLWLRARLDGRWPEPWESWATSAAGHKLVIARFRKFLVEPLSEAMAELPGQVEVEKLLFGTRGEGRGSRQVTGWVSGRLAGLRPTLGPLVLSYAHLDPDWTRPRIAERTVYKHGASRAEALWPNISQEPADDFLAALGLSIGLTA